MKILVVDDEEDIRTTTRLLLEMHGHKVVTSGSWQEARDSAVGVDVVLQDVRMPGLDLESQITALQAVAGRVILFTGEQMTDLDAAATGADAFVQKPFHMDELTAALR